MKYEINDQKLSELMKKFSTPELSDHFEDKIMNHIESMEKTRPFFIKNLSAAWLFFLLGLVSGSLLTKIISEIDFFVYGISFEKLKYPFQIMIGLVILFLMEKLIKLTRKYYNMK